MEDRILLYSERLLEEQPAVGAHGVQHPKLLPRLEEARLLRADLPGYEVHAYYLTAHHVSPHPMSASFGDVFAHIEAQLEAGTPMRALPAGIPLAQGDAEGMKAALQAVLAGSG